MFRSELFYRKKTKQNNSNMSVLCSSFSTYCSWWKLWTTAMSMWWRLRPRSVLRQILTLSVYRMRKATIRHRPSTYRINQGKVSVLCCDFVCCDGLMVVQAEYSSPSFNGPSLQWFPPNNGCFSFLLNVSCVIFLPIMATPCNGQRLYQLLLLSWIHLPTMSSAKTGTLLAKQQYSAKPVVSAALCIHVQREPTPLVE